ncbi:uncharacterized protein BT62DRAFT_295505 [Guyanagaster necrorhizus]|uniref:DUF6533 domain-containing protein n=1 Tax=Guyanagaster necrorhizus TaxID=856835 RepID=A0A9P8AY53_9AGAR|nr:uncharacterized protein BT62DRAFT_295505 [Guyanagaster necrorhizus MCA 3950]KAG7452283.1 hypothetical protein BT62DRAFT_295505 [Guyanagaster necrorhizus MCA 3950]
MAGVYFCDLDVCAASFRAEQMSRSTRPGILVFPSCSQTTIVSSTKMSDTPETAHYFIYGTQIYFCAMYAVVLWDWMISLPREWRFVWKTHWTPVKVAYLFCRYWVIIVVPYLLFCFVVDHSLETCRKIYKVPVALAMWNQVGSESVLLIRTYAFFNRNVYILWMFICAIGGVVAYQLYVDTTQMLLLPFTTPPYDRGPCFPMSKPHSAHLLGFFIAPLLFDTLVTFMTIVKAFMIRRCNGGSSSRLIQTFIREGVFYYILISIANLINGIFYLQPRQVISAINIPLSVMMGPVLACRLILDLRERGSETVSHSEGTGMAAFTTKSITQNQTSPFTPPHRSKGGYGFGGSRHARTVDSNIVLSTLGSIPPDMDMSPEQDIVEMDDIRSGLGLELGSLSTAIGGDEGEPISDDGRIWTDDDVESGDFSLGSRNPYRALEIGIRPAHGVPSLSESGIQGIQVDVEKATASMQPESFF